MPRRVTRAEAVAEVVRIAGAVTDRTALIGIDGFGAAGKSSLAAAMAGAVTDAAVVHVDDFWGPGIPEWDWERFRREVLTPVRAGRPARYRRWDWVQNRGGGWVDLLPPRVLIVEGVSATRAELAAPWDLTVWVTAPRELRLQRAVERDGTATLPRWLDDWMPSEQAYAAREHPEQRVDLVVSGAEVLSEADATLQP